MQKALNAAAKRGKLLPVIDGFAVCPQCRASGICTKLIRIRPETRADRLQLYCRRHHAEYIVDICEGQCFESQGQ